MIRWLIRRDVDNVASFGLQTKEEIIATARKDNTVPMVYEKDGEIIGYIVWELKADHIPVIILFSKTDEGYVALLNKVKYKLIGNRTYVEFDVDERDLQTQLLLKENGFVAESFGDYYSFKYHRVYNNRLAEYFEEIS